MGRKREGSQIWDKQEERREQGIKIVKKGKKAKGGKDIQMGDISSHCGTGYFQLWDMKPI